MEIFGFLGSNGCGKTTTMKMLTGLLPASEGEARLFGARRGPSGYGHAPTRRLHVASVLLYGELTVRQNLSCMRDCSICLPNESSSGWQTWC